MREPYAVMSDCPRGKSSDQTQLQNLTAYMNYDAHYVSLAFDGCPLLTGQLTA